MGRNHSKLIALACITASGPVHAGPPPSRVLEPSSKWTIDYAEDRCRAIRFFGEKDDPTVLILDQYAPSHTLYWTIAGAAVPNRAAIDVQFGPAYQKMEIPREGLTLGRVGPSVFGLGFERPSPVFHSSPSRKNRDDSEDEETQHPNELDAAEAAQLSWVDIEQGSRREARLNLGDMKPLYAAMNTCMRDLLSSWGVDPATQARVETPVDFLNAGEVAREVQKWYPAAAISRLEQGVMQVRVMVEADGTPSKCAITMLTSSEHFDSKPCVYFIERARFAPARDAQGNPLRSFYSTRIIYKIS